MIFSEAVVETSRRLASEGKRDVGLEWLREHANAGNVDAMIELAQWKMDEGNAKESDRWLLCAEEAVQPNDLDGHIALNGAYNTGLGSGDSKSRGQRALHHLEHVAAFGNSVAQVRVAFHYLHGLNGCTQDASKFEYWIKRAVESDDPSAIYAYADFLLKDGRLIPSAVMRKLAVASQANEDAARLLRRVSRRQSHPKSS